MFASLAENPCRTGVVANVSGSDSLARGVTAPETIVYGGVYALTRQVLAHYPFPAGCSLMVQLGATS